MKKFMLLALAALCVSAAQAVTCTWNSSEGAFAGFKKTNGDTVTWAGEFSITVNFTATSTPETIFQLLTANGAGKAGEFRFNSNNNWSGNTANFATYKGDDSAVWMATNGDFSNARVVSTDGSKSNTIKLTFNGYNDDNNTYASVSYDIIFANGDQQTYTITNTLHSTGAITFGMEELAWTSIATGEGVTINSMTLDATPVPEPTALALLALGVAGLALKRKVA